VPCIKRLFLGSEIALESWLTFGNDAGPRVIKSEHPSVIMDIPQVREWLEMVQQWKSRGQQNNGALRGRTDA